MRGDLQQQEPGSAMSLTFILPTLNRREWVGRAIESCLQSDQPDVRVEVLVVDGHSTDGSFEELQERYRSDSRVRLIRQEGARGFMSACFFAVPLVRTPWATFMYDDDVLSPHWLELPRELRRRGGAFAMSLGKVSDIAQVMTFERPRPPVSLAPDYLIRCYCGCGCKFAPYGLPFSPICCLTRTDWLREWVQEVQRFAAGVPLREYYLLERNAGPDLMIYLLSLLKLEQDVLLFNAALAQFSSHVESMTIQFESSDLRLGYWLPRVWLCDYLRQCGQHADACLCAALVAKAGLHLLWRRARRGNRAWLSELWREIRGLTARTLVSRSAMPFVKTLPVLLLPRPLRPNLNPMPDIKLNQGWIPKQKEPNPR